GNVRALSGALVLTGKGFGDFNTSLDAMKNSAGLTDKAFEVMNNSLVSKFGKMKNRLKNMSTEIMQGTGGQLGVLVDNITGKLKQWQEDGTIDNIANKVADGFMKMYDVLSKVFSFIAEHKDAIANLGIGFASLYGAIKTINTLKTTLAGLKGVATIVDGALKISAFGWIGLAIAGVIAVGLLLWKNWDSIKEVAVSLWTTISTVFTNIWTSVTTVFTNIWTTISTVATNIWTSITTVFTNIWTSITTVATNIWTAISTVFTNIFNFIVTIFTPIATIIEAIFKGILAVIIIVATSIWTTITTIFTAVWATISSIFTAIWGVISSVFTAIFGVISSICSAIFGVISSIWNSILGTISGILSGIWSTVSGIWSSIYGTISGIVGNIASSISGGFSALIGICAGIFNNIKDTVMGIFQGIWDGVKSIINGGIDMMNGFIGGVNKVISKANKVPGVNIGSVTEIPHFAKGTQYSPAGMALINEEGGELRKLSSGETIIPADKSRELMNGASSPTFNIYFTGNVGSEEFFNQAGQHIVNQIKLSMQNM
ncbi:phage tail tape measure protein, partial [Clostridium sporogenes]|nr:phage tail tape measure protein [Clostridium sporogenes]